MLTCDFTKEVISTQWKNTSVHYPAYCLPSIKIFKGQIIHHSLASKCWVWQIQPAVSFKFISPLLCTLPKTFLGTLLETISLLVSVLLDKILINFHVSVLLDEILINFHPAWSAPTSLVGFTYKQTIRKIIKFRSFIWKEIPATTDESWEVY